MQHTNGCGGIGGKEWRKSATLGDRDNKAAERKGRMKGWTLKNKPDASSGEPNNTQSQAWWPPCGCICLEDFGEWRAVWGYMSVYMKNRDMHSHG